MQYYVFSDFHVDLWCPAVAKPSRLKKTEIPKDIVERAMDYIWKLRGIPETEGIILAGDYSNDFHTFSLVVPWLSNRYKRVIMVLGNHDILVRGATLSKSNQQFTSSEQKIAKMKEICAQAGNVFLLDGDDGPYIEGIAGCMGMCDFQCEPPMYGLDKYTLWKRNWFDGVNWIYFHQEPQAIWSHYESKLTDMLNRHPKPKVIVTHFAPYELGVPFDYRNSPWNYVFYFKAEKFLDMMDDDTYWICGHTHGIRKVEYVNASGNHIHLWCNPMGYIGELTEYMEIDDYMGDKVERKSSCVKEENFIIEL